MLKGNIVKTTSGVMTLSAIARANTYSVTAEITTVNNTNINIKGSSHSLISDDSNQQINARLIATFKPMQDWKGENFGFDTLSKYNNVVGKYYDKDGKKLILSGRPESTHIFRLNNGLPNNQGDNRALGLEYNVIGMYNQTDKPRMYVVPWLSLMKDKTAKLQMQVTIEEPADALRFDDNDNFEITPNQFNGSANATYDITIKCLKQFPSDQKLILRSYKKNLDTNNDDVNIAGKISVWANKEVFELKMVLVSVNVDGQSMKVQANEIKIAEDTLNHAGVIQRIQRFDLDLSGSKEFRDNFLRNVDGDNKLVMINDISISEAKVNNVLDTPPQPGVERKLMDEVLKAEMSKHTKYKGWMPVFCFAMDLVKETHEGHYSIENHSISLFKNRRKQVFAHEVFHSLGLQHTFDNAGYDGSTNILFTYPYRKTHNIMDYDGGINTYHWQWEMVRRVRLREIAKIGAITVQPTPISPVRPEKKPVVL